MKNRRTQLKSRNEKVEEGSTLRLKRVEAITMLSPGGKRGDGNRKRSNANAADRDASTA